MGERHVSNEPDTTISSRALLKGFYECILDGNSFVNVRAIAKKSQPSANGAESCENTETLLVSTDTSRGTETIEFLLLIIGISSGCFILSGQQFDLFVSSSSFSFFFFYLSISFSSHFSTFSWSFYTLDTLYTLGQSLSLSPLDIQSDQLEHRDQ